MITPGDITLSGDLYEGNFEEWQLVMTGCLRSRDLERQVGPEAELFRTIAPEASRSAAMHIRLRTSEAMLRRVPDAHLKNGGRLFKSLKKLATPFRFFDLPAEIRNRVYEFVLPTHYVVQDNSVDAEEDSWDSEEEEEEEYSKPWRDDYPKLLQVNSQIRHEASSIFYATTRFSIALPYDGTASDVDREAIEKWSKNVAGGNLKHLHLVALSVGIEAQVDIRFSEKRGLTCDFDGSTGEISDEGDRLLEEHSRDIESARTALGLRGEAVVLALLSNWGLWNRLHEEIEEAFD